MAGDIYYNNVVLLLHGENNGNNTIIDSSIKNNIITTTNAILSNTQYVFGSSSIYFNGSSRLDISNNVNDFFNLGINDFTIECYINLTSLSGAILCIGNYINNGILFYIENGRLTIYKAGKYQDPVVRITTNTWYKIGYVRNSGIIYFYVNNVQVYSINLSGNIFPDNILAIGVDPIYGGFNLNGYIDEYRITKNIARDLSIPQTTQFPDYSNYIDVIITENVITNNFICNVYDLSTYELLKTTVLQQGLTRIGLNQSTPVFTTIIPEQGSIWKPNTSYNINDLVFPSNPSTIPYYFKRTTAGTSSSTEPTWDTIINNYTTDNRVSNAWQCVSRIIQPITHSPIIPE